MFLTFMRTLEKNSDFSREDVDSLREDIVEILKAVKLEKGLVVNMVFKDLRAFEYRVLRKRE